MLEFIRQARRPALLTLTYSSKAKLDAATIARHLEHFWETYRASTSRRQPIHYIRVVESTKRGIPHFHYLVDGVYDAGRIDQRLMSNIWKRVTGHSYIVDIRPADSGSATYLAKYLGKGSDKDRDRLFKKYGLARAFQISSGAPVSVSTWNQRFKRQAAYRAETNKPVSDLGITEHAMMLPPDVYSGEVREWRYNCPKCKYWKKCSPHAREAQRKGREWAVYSQYKARADQDGRLLFGNWVFDDEKPPPSQK
jgi:hypothetical protein